MVQEAVPTKLFWNLYTHTFSKRDHFIIEKKYFPFIWNNLTYRKREQTDSKIYLQDLPLEPTHRVGHHKVLHPGRIKILD